MKKRLTMFVEGDTDRLFFSYLIDFLFKNANKRKWDKSQLRIISLDGICNAEGIIENTIYELQDRSQYADTICLIYDTDAFEYQKQPPVKLERVRKIVKGNGFEFFSIPIIRNVEDMIVFSLEEIVSFLKISSNFKIPKGMDGLSLLKKLHKEAGQYYVKGYKCDELLKCLNYSSISKKYCSIIKPLCNYLELECSQNLCKIKRKK